MKRDDRLSSMANEQARQEGFRKLDQYVFRFKASVDENDVPDTKTAVRAAVVRAIESRENRGIKSGTLDVFLSEDGLSGQVVDTVHHVAEEAAAEAVPSE